MDTGPISPTAAKPSMELDAERPSGQANAVSAAASDFETFLSLLTSQMRNQDPLKPMESTEFVAQLASFSAVEQQIRSNETLEAILANLEGAPSAGLAGWLGQEVETTASASFDGAPVALSVTPPADAEQAVLTVTDMAGREVARLPVDPSARTLSWEGRTPWGEAPPGAYSFSVAYMAGGERIETAPVRGYAPARELRLGAEGPKLVLEGGAEVSPDEVTGLRPVGPEQG